MAKTKTKVDKPKETPKTNDVKILSVFEQQEQINSLIVKIK